MSFFSWFGKRAPVPEPEAPHSSGLGHSDATIPMYASQRATPPPTKHPEVASSRNARLERRELLYSVVRECMTGAGVLSSCYKFKVLSLDSSGRKYLIMVDIPQAYLSDPTRFAEIEGAIARSAKERFDILVTALYWRINEVVTASQQRPAASRGAAASDSPQAAVPVARPSAAVVSEDRDAALEEEVLAFKQAVASAAKNAARARPGEVVRSKRRTPEPVPDFSDTEPFDASSPLGPSQFGGLK